jgi:hypothetical protein
MTNHDDLVESRKADYGETFQIVDRWIRENFGAIAASPSPYSLIMIYAKLTRALTSPNKQDHYDDIIGYTKLLLRELEAAEEKKEAHERLLDSMSDLPGRSEHERTVAELRRQKRGF